MDTIYPIVRWLYSFLEISMAIGSVETAYKCILKYRELVYKKKREHQWRNRLEEQCSICVLCCTYNNSWLNLLLFV